MNTTQSGMRPPDEHVRDAASSDRGAWRWSWPARLAFMFTGVVLPIVCFAIGFGFPGQHAWQSGDLEVYAGLLLSHKPASALYPFLLYSMTSMTLLVFAPGRFSKNFAARLGIYSGALLALLYWVIFAIAMSLGSNIAEDLLFMAFSSLLGVFVPWIPAWLIVLLSRKFGKVLLWPGAALILLGIGGVLVATDYWDIEGVLINLCIMCFFCATAWAVAAYTVMAIHVIRNSGVTRLRFSLAQLLGVTTWLAAHLAAWRVSFIWMLQEYAKLPTTRPGGCYVCTAAARGHRRLVHSEDQMAPSGKICQVNDQMRYLKAAELLLASISLPAHRVCRRIYDLIGPKLAATLVHPLLADAAYLSLKPAEWLCRAALAVLLPGRGELSRSIYRPGR